MTNVKWISRLPLVISLLLNGCVPLSIPSKINSQPNTTPTKQRPTLVTNFVLEPDFDCWNEINTQMSNPLNGDSLFFEISDGDPGSLRGSLYRYSMERREYSLIASQLETTLFTSWMHSYVSPTQDRFWYLAQGSDGYQRMYIYQIDQAEPIEVPLFLDRVAAPAVWSPDGTCLFFNTGEELVAFQLTEKTLQRKAILADSVVDFDVSPIGKWWAFTEADNQGVLLATLTGNKNDSLVIKTGFRSGYPNWSPDGTLLAFAYSDNSLYYNNVRLVKVHNDGSTEGKDILQLASIDSMQWSGDSKTLLIYGPSKADPKTYVAAYDTVSEKVRQIPIPVKGVDKFTISPDGNKILYSLVDENDQRKNAKIFIFDIDTSKTIEIPFPETFSRKNYARVEALYWLKNQSE